MGVDGFNIETNPSTGVAGRGLQGPQMKRRPIVGCHEFDAKAFKGLLKDRTNRQELLYILPGSANDPLRFPNSKERTGRWAQSDNPLRVIKEENRVLNLL